MPADLWSFTLDLYAQPGVEQACLRLQDQGADVCMLMCGAWLGQRGVACTPSRAQALAGIAVPWQLEVISPLRALRTQWRAATAEDRELASLREAVKGLELKAEQTLLERLQVVSADWQRDQTPEVGVWLESLAGEIAGQDRDALQMLCAAAGTTAGLA